jgi:erythronate-4-phosphate dehydrogenase
LKIVIDQNIRGAVATFAQHGELVAMDGRDIRREHLIDADLLIIRTTTKVNADLLEGTAVRFVGTTAIGTDHLDTAWLDQQGIRWCNAPGCNADSAAQYTLAMIWLACERLGRRLDEQRVGIIGRGNVGSRLQKLLNTLGVETVANDPPLADEGIQGLVSQAEALSCDIVSLHVPLTGDGPYPTLRMISEEQLARMPEGALLVNAARGNVVDGAALLDAAKAGRVQAALDCWPNEPLLDPELLDRTMVATPHVAGYSDDGKRNGTWMVYHAFCEWAGVEPASDGDNARRGQSLSIQNPENALSEALEATCFVSVHDRAMRELKELSSARIAHHFDQLRKDYPYRRDFHGWNVSCGDQQAAGVLNALGFRRIKTCLSR